MDKNLIWELNRLLDWINSTYFYKTFEIYRSADMLMFLSFVFVIRRQLIIYLYVHEK